MAGRSRARRASARGLRVEGEETIRGMSTSELLGAALARDAASLIDLLSSHGGLAGLSRAGVAELHAALGSEAQAMALASAFELGRRVASEAHKAPRIVGDASDVVRWALPLLGALCHEELWLLALDGRSRLRACRRIAMGGIHGAAVRISDPLRAALQTSASGFILVHNHPSGDATPSVEDVRFTRAVAAAAVVIGVPLLDHVVVAGSSSSSVPFEAPAPLGESLA